MKKGHGITTAFAVSLTLAAPGQACIMPVPFDINDVKKADIVVLGRIKNYEIVQDQKARKRRTELLAGDTTMSPESRKVMEEQKYFQTDYARFEIHVDEAIKGSPPKVIGLTWNNSGKPKPGKSDVLLFALKSYEPRAPSPELSSKTGSMAGQRIYSILGHPCSGAFILEPAKENISSVRAALSGKVLVVGDDRSSSPEPEVSFGEKLKEHWTVIVAALVGFSILGFAGFRTLQTRKRKTV